jgi:hypothetical protein
MDAGEHKPRGLTRRNVLLTGGAGMLSAGGWLGWELSRDLGPYVLSDADHDSMLISETPYDWVEFADHAVVVRATGPERRMTEGGFGGRRVRLDCRRVLWSRPGAPRPPRSVENVWVRGWARPEDDLFNRERRAVLEKSCRIELGHTYIVALVHIPGEGWIFTEQDGALPFDGGIIGNGEWEGSVRRVARSNTDTVRVPARPDDETIPVPMHVLLHGKPASGLVRLLRETEPDPLAVKYAALPLRERQEKIFKAREEKGG